MEKLEKILQAEDVARAGVQDARAAASRTISEARARAAEALRTGRDDIRASAAAHGGEILARARADSAALADSAAGEARSALATAEARTDSAVDAVLQVLKGL